MIGAPLKFPDRDYGFFLPLPFFAFFTESATRVESAFFTESAMRTESAIRIESLIAGGAAAGGVVSFAALSALEQAATAITAATKAKRFILVFSSEVLGFEQRWSLERCPDARRWLT
jgi:hypothetical protein